MNLEQQVCSLDLAKKLKELGVKQESEFYWIHTSSHGDEKVYGRIGNRNTCQEYTGKNISAFTVAELGEKLPPFAHSWFIEGDNVWHCDWKKLPSGSPSSQADTEADARAKMLIYLLENKLI